MTTKLIAFFEIGDRYFRAASPTSIERNIYSVHVPIDAHSVAVERPNALTDTSAPSYYSASFSPDAGFYLLSFEGPGVPYQKLIKVGDESGSNSRILCPLVCLSGACVVNARLLVANTVLNDTVHMYESPTVIHSTIEIEGYGKEVNRALFVGMFNVFPGAELNAVELRPPNMDESGKTKYPVLFHL